MVGRSIHIPLILLGTLFFGACSVQDKTSGPVQVKVIQPVAGHCKYSVSPAKIETLDSLINVRGKLGSVVTTSENLGSRNEILDTFDGLNAVDAQFAASGSTYAPLDYPSLFAVSLYYAVERAHLVFAGLDARADMPAVVPNFANRTRFVYEAKRTFGEIGVDADVSDNAEYLGHSVSGRSDLDVNNFLFSFPTDEIADVPLGLNVGVMAHEYSHLVMNHLFWLPAIAEDKKVESDSKPTKNTLAALDEGLADYFGFLASNDAGFFLCSLPDAKRDLRVPKTYSETVVARLDGQLTFYPHQGGAVFAAINYEIGQAIGFQENGKLLVAMMATLKDCSAIQSGGKLSLNFADIAQCHVQQANGSQQSTMRTIYNKYLGEYGSI